MSQKDSIYKQCDLPVASSRKIAPKPPAQARSNSQSFRRNQFATSAAVAAAARKKNDETSPSIENYHSKFSEYFRLITNG